MEKKQLLALANELTTSDLIMLIELNKSKILVHYDCGGFAVLDEVTSVRLNGTCIQLNVYEGDAGDEGDE